MSPKPLGTVRFRGMVRGLTLQQVQVLYVDVDYTPWWICEFLRLPDCGLGAWRVTSVELGTDGRFSATLPNLLGMLLSGRSSIQASLPFGFAIRRRAILCLN